MFYIIYLLRAESESVHHMLNSQADRIEMILAHHRASARVAGGTVTPRWIQFHLTPAPSTRLGRIEALTNELALALGAVHVRVSRQGQTVVVNVPRPDPQPIHLVDLCRRLPAIPLGACVLGVAEDGAPVLLRLSAPDVAHVLVAGTT